MEEKHRKNQEKVNVKKRRYTPPMLILYGKLADLTAGGTNASGEPGNSKVGNRKP